MPGLPELDIARVCRWCQQRVPEHARGQVRVECDIGARHLTIIECRPPWRQGTGPDWTRFPIARLRYTQATRTWTLYWRDRHLRFHLYDQLEPSPDIGPRNHPAWSTQKHYYSRRPDATGRAAACALVTAAAPLGDSGRDLRQIGSGRPARCRPAKPGTR